MPAQLCELGKSPFLRQLELGSLSPRTEIVPTGAASKGPVALTPTMAPKTCLNPSRGSEAQPTALLGRPTVILPRVSISGVRGARPTVSDGAFERHTSLTVLRWGYSPLPKWWPFFRDLSVLSVSSLGWAGLAWATAPAAPGCWTRGDLRATCGDNYMM